VKRKGGVRFIPIESPFHHLNPATKAAALVLVSAATLVTARPAPILCILLLIVAAAAFSGLMLPFLRSLRLLIPLLLFIMVIDAFFPRIAGDPVWFSAEIWIFHPTLSAAGVLFSLAMGLRILAVGGASFLFIMTTRYADFVRSLRALGLPATLSFSLGYALRSISALTEDLGNIMDAQRSRAFSFDRNTLLKNRHAVLALFIPATIAVLARARQVADAMQCRGFGCADRPTCYRRHPFGAADALLILIAALTIPFALLCT
jgi:energy-coupling factor transport system permease protein